MFFNFLRQKSIGKLVKEKLDFVVILGSGYTNVLSDLELKISIPYKNIKNAFKTSVPGHSGVLELRTLKDKNIAILRGRNHLYEGYSPFKATALIKDLVLSQKKLNNSPIFILTNASGSTKSTLEPGNIVLIRDHINTIWKTPLLGPLFTDMTDVYDSSLRNKIKINAKKLGIDLKEAVYAITPGPQYETPAEVKMLNKLGADILGMSTVPEAILLQNLGIKKLALSIIANFGTGVSEKKLSHNDVSTVVKQTTSKISKLIKEFISG